MIKIMLFLSLVFDLLVVPGPSQEIWAEPIPYLEENLEQDYLAPVSEFGTGHRGIDFQLEAGQLLSSPASGAVHFAGKVVDRMVITIRTDSGKLASFEPVCSNLKQGDRVLSGQPIGTWCPGAPGYQEHCERCVHASARDEFGYLSPLHMMGQKSPSVIIG